MPESVSHNMGAEAKPLTDSPVYTPPPQHGEDRVMEKIQPVNFVIRLKV